MKLFFLNSGQIEIKKKIFIPEIIDEENKIIKYGLPKTFHEFNKIKSIAKVN